MKNLDLYAKVEPLIGFYEEYEKLYQIYLKELSNFDIKSVLDVGCGNGSMLFHLKRNRYLTKGIDLSAQMVEYSKEKGVDAACKDISEVNEKFDALLAVADVLNYLDYAQLQSFFENVERSLVDGGLFLCDINTLFGFEEVTAGSMSIDRDGQFLNIEADFNEDILVTQITLFEKAGVRYTKEQEEIIQYYYEEEEITSSTSLKLLYVKEIALFDRDIDKILFVFQKSLS